MNKKFKFTIELVPLFFSLGMLIFGIPTRQYAFCFVALVMIVGFSVVWAIAESIKFPKHIKSGSKWIKVTGFLLILGSDISFAFFARGTLNPRRSVQVWNMHEIDNPGFVLPNGLDSFDVNKDGFDDYVSFNIYLVTNFCFCECGSFQGLRYYYDAEAVLVYGGYR